jgi:hypothetical protein
MIPSGRYSATAHWPTVIFALGLALASANAISEYWCFRLASARVDQIQGLAYDHSLAGSGGPEWLLPARGHLLRGMLRTAEAADFGVATAEGRRLLGDAEDDLAIASAGRMYWPELTLARSYLAMVRDGVGKGSTLDPLEQSYAEAGYLRDGALWRIRLAIANWPRLDPVTRHRVVLEAIWYARIKKDNYALAFSLVRNSPAEALFLDDFRSSPERDDKPA